MATLNLPDISFVDTDPGRIQAAIITTYEAIANRTLAPGDPVRLFLQTVATIIVQQRVLIDYSAKQNLLAYAVDDNLDHLGALIGVPRLKATAAQTTIRFTLSAAQPQVVTIPAGTRCTTQNGITFSVTTPVNIAIGAIYGDAPADCTETGISGNGYVPGQINQLTDPLPWVKSVANITESAGGANREDNDPYRLRIRQAPESFSVAGPTGAYRFWAQSASQHIIDVAVYSPAAGEVVIRPLLADGEIPGNEILDAVAAICNDETIRPLTDQVTVLAPEAVNYEINMTYYIAEENATRAIQIQSEVNQAVADYILWQKTKLGRSINPSELITRVRSAGASRVDMTEPEYMSLAAYQVAISNTVNVVYGGLGDG